jgi:predicted enzyme related to lactoylglutathione lyase
VFGFGFDQVTDNGQGMLTSGGSQLASISLQPQEGMPATWNPVIGVDSVDDVEAKAVGLGATVLMSRMPVPGGLASAFSAPVTGTMVLIFETATSD